MKIRTNRKRMNTILRWTQGVLFAGGAVLLGYCGFVFVDSSVFQYRQSVNLRRLLEVRDPGSHLPAIQASGLIGRLEIPRLGLSVVLIEGDDARILRRAVGHVPSTPLPGQTGNSALTGHRDTFFRPLKNIHADDIITVTTLDGEYRYRVVSTSVVSPDNVSVLNAGQGEMLTLITCYPFYFVGSAPDRFIVRAERLHSAPSSSGPG